MELVTINEITSKNIIALNDWYVDLPLQKSNWPSISEFRPETIPPKIIPNIGKVMVEVDPFRVFYRVVGTVICESFGRNLSGMYLDESGLTQKDQLEEIYKFILTHNDVFFIKDKQTIMGREFEYEGCALPFGCESDDPRGFVIAEDYLPETAWKEALSQRSYETSMLNR